MGVLVIGINSKLYSMDEREKSMYFRAKAPIFEAAHLLRKYPTIPENLLWEKICQKKILGLRFRRQHPIDIFIADFYCHSAKLVIEIDGEIHKYQKEHDIGRTAELERYGIEVIRFSNSEVESNIDKVIEEIQNVVKARMQSPPWGI